VTNRQTAAIVAAILIPGLMIGVALLRPWTWVKPEVAQCMFPGNQRLNEWQKQAVRDRYGCR